MKTTVLTVEDLHDLREAVHSKIALSQATYHMNVAKKCNSIDSYKIAKTVYKGHLDHAEFFMNVLRKKFSNIDNIDKVVKYLVAYFKEYQSLPKLNKYVGKDIMDILAK